MKIIDIELDWEKDVRFTARLGEPKKNSDTTRPLLIGFKDNITRNKVLSNARKLAESEYDNVQIVPDLTKKQRLDDANVRKECEKMNSQLSEEVFYSGSTRHWEKRAVCYQ